MHEPTAPLDGATQIPVLDPLLRLLSPTIPWIISPSHNTSSNHWVSGGCEVKTMALRRTHLPSSHQTMRHQCSSVLSIFGAMRAPQAPTFFQPAAGMILVDVSIGSIWNYRPERFETEVEEVGWHDENGKMRAFRTPPTTTDPKLPLNDSDQCIWHFTPIFAYVSRQCFIEYDCHSRSVEKAK